MSEPAAPAGSAFVRLARNGAISATAEILAKVCSLLFFVVVARKLGGDTLGRYVFALALTSLVWSFAGFGLDRLGMREIARDPARMRRIAVPMAVMKGGAALIIVLVCAAVLAVAGEATQTVWLVLILGTGTALGMVASTAQTVCAANERMDYLFLLKVPLSIATALGGSAVLLAGGSIVAASLVTSFGVGLATTVWSWTLVIRRFGAPEGGLRVREWPGTLRQAVPFGVQEMLGQIIFRFDTVLLAAVAASAVVGAYGASYRMLESTLFIAWSVGYAVMPMFSYLPEGHELSRIFEGSLKLLLCVMAPLAAVLLVCAPAIVDLFYGLPEYDQSVGVLRLLAPAVAVYSLGHIAGLVVLVRRPGRVTVSIAAVVAVVNVIACAVLIPLLEARGAAISTLIGEGMLALLGLVFARRVTGPQRLVWVAASPLLAAAVMALAMWPLADNLWLALPAGGVAYLLVLLALEAPRLREDVAVFREISGRRPDLAALVEEPITP